MSSVACGDEVFDWVKAGGVVSGIFHLLVAAAYSRSSYCRDVFLLTLRTLLWVIGVGELLSWIGGGWGRLFSGIAAISTGFLFAMGFFISIAPVYERWPRHMCYTFVLMLIGTSLGGLALWVLIIVTGNVYPIREQDIVVSPGIIFESIVWEPVAFATLLGLTTVLLFSTPLETFESPPLVASAAADELSNSQSSRCCIGIHLKDHVTNGNNDPSNNYLAVLTNVSAPSSITIILRELKELLLRSSLAAFVAIFSLALVRFCLVLPAHLWYHPFRTYAILALLIVLRFCSSPTAATDYLTSWVVLTIKSHHFILLPVLRFRSNQLPEPTHQNNQNGSNISTPAAATAI